jgi:adenine-specific DNA-methyltransferase
MTAGPLTTRATSGLVERTEQRRQVANVDLDGKTKASRGQFFTPSSTAEFIAALPDLPAAGRLRILDPGAGIGSLTAALVARILRDRPELEVDVTACEVDTRLTDALAETLADCEECGKEAGTVVRTRLVLTDFIDWAAGDRRSELGAFDMVIMNPPYLKLGKGEARAAVAQAAVDVPNLYAAFLSLGVNLLAEGGRLVAITPRSFTNGPYFRGFRQFFLDRMDLERFHLYASRTSVFADSAVLQENVVFAAVRRETPRRQALTISYSDGSGDAPVERSVEYAEVVYPDDPEFFLHLSTDAQDAELARTLAALPATLPTLGLAVSTGRVVDFRASEHLREDPEAGSVPLIYPLHLRDGLVRWPVPGARKCNAIMLNDATERQTYPHGHYVVVKRLSSKEEKRRVVAAFYDADDEKIPRQPIGFENHVNVFHSDGQGFEDKALAQGLCLWLNSTLLDRFIRRFNGHTQINATDLRNLRYPSAAELVSLGEAWGGGAWPGQEKIDSLVVEHVNAISKDSATII